MLVQQFLCLVALCNDDIKIECVCMFCVCVFVCVFFLVCVCVWLCVW